MSICNFNQKFKGVSSISQDLLINILESNFKMFFDWSFLNIGAWFDANRDQYKLYNPSANAPSTMILADDPSYDAGQVWQGIRKDWVWESGIECFDNEPIAISGIYVDNNFINIDGPFPSGLSYNIDYPLGRVVFENSVDTDSVVEVDHSYRFVQVYRGSDSPWTNIIQLSSFDTSNKDIQKLDSGDWAIGGNHRIQLPCIIIEPVARSRSRPHELGNDNLIIEQDIEFYILAENKNDRNKILDILRLQQDSNIWLFDTNKLSEDENYPLNHMGNLVENALMYPDIISQYKWRKCWLKNVNLFDINIIHPELFIGVCRITAEIISD